MANSNSDSGAATAPAHAINLSSGNDAVDAIGQMHFEGNIIDHRWMSAPELRLKNGRINLPALVVLADLVYWHRPVIVRDEQTNIITAVRRKFRYDRLYKDYESWGASLGLTKRQTQDAVAFLHATKVIKRSVGRLKFDDGVRSNTLVFLEVEAERLKEITYRQTLPTFKQREAPHVAAGGDARRNGRRPTPQRGAINNREHTETSDTNNNTPLDVDLLEKLIALDVDAKVAEALIRRDSSEVERQLEALPHRKPAEDPAAFIVAAITKRYTLPNAAKRIHARDIASPAPATTATNETTEAEALMQAARQRGDQLRKKPGGDP